MSEQNQDSFKARRQRQVKELTLLEQRLEKLRVEYEQFFLGIINVPPNPKRDRLRRDVRHSELRKAKNTALRFRYQNLTQKLATYATYWERTQRKIEEGTHRRSRPQD
jgi:formiminotetrahydrofolate cyclodeaminase